ncbi:hydroxymethylpyrimidine/phosphomethylpyrimidine kinase [Massilia arenosa]|uniref:hydroxymethylpyrimidine kinase n=2 Tax=Zemynaea arenosa TaxID=2561931 RepID=A0A4Y9S8Z4_9BURK|nr:hydroxymethylpyrimidine/phosphomethylpyrimidine kinase [Massilia arenosa]
MGAPTGRQFPHHARPAVLVFAGLDPSGGAGIAADIEAISANGAHALPIVTALTVQDQNRVHGLQCVDAALIERQARALVDGGVAIHAVKLGVPGNAANAHAIARVITHLRKRDPQLPVVLDPVLASGAGDALSQDEYATKWLHILLPLATIATPNEPESLAADYSAVPHLLVTGGHSDGPTILNQWHARLHACDHAPARAPAPRLGSVPASVPASPGAPKRTWSWPRLPGSFHGSGCTLAASIAAALARGLPLEDALMQAQTYTHRTLSKAYAIGAGQLIPRRALHT